MSKIVNDAISLAKNKYLKSLNELTPNELHDVISTAVMGEIADNWMNSRNKRIKERTAFYFSAEFLVGRAIYNNLVSKGVYDEVEKDLNEYGVSLKALEDIEDAALGNGGLGRLAATFLKVQQPIILRLMATEYVINMDFSSKIFKMAFRLNMLMTGLVGVTLGQFIMKTIQ